MESMVNFWKDKKVLLTGHTGFKGSWLTLLLKQLGAQVIGVALDPPGFPNLYEAANVALDIVDIRCDINDYTKLAAIFIEQQPDIVFHLAAQSLVRHSYVDPLQTYATNVMGTVHVLEAARQCSSIRAIVNVTSDKCYENKEWLWGYREIEPMGGVDPYSSSKGCAELVTAAYRHSYFNSTANSTGLASARAGNVIGGGDWARDRLIPDFVRACVQRQPVNIRHPHSIRPWQHVLDSGAGYLCLAEHLYRQPKEYSEAWNFGPFDSDSKTVEWIVNAMLNLWDVGVTWELTHPSTYEARYLKLDCSKALTRLNWKPKWDIETAIVATVEWYKAFYQSADMRALTLRQIDDYIKV